MTSPQVLVQFCLLAEGFPSDICPAEVAKVVSSTTRSRVTAVSPPSHPRTGNTTERWLLRLDSHDDQKKCLQNYRTFLFNHGNVKHQIKLDFPGLAVQAQGLNWIVMDQDDERADSVASEDMFGDGRIASAVPRQTDQRSGVPAGPQLHPLHGQVGTPRHAGPGQSTRLYAQALSSAEYVPANHPGPGWNNYQRQPPMNYPQRFGPTFSELGLDPRSSPRTSHQSQELGNEQAAYTRAMGRDQREWDVYTQQQSQHYPQGPTRGPRAQFADFAHPGAPSPQQGQTMGNEAQYMAELKLHPYNQPYGYSPANMTDPDMDSQSDTVVLDSPGSDDGNPHHQFYLHVTELPEQVSEQMLMEFFQDRRQSGGGSVSSIDLNQSARSAAVYFHDSEDIQRVIQRAPLLMRGKKIQVKAASAQHQEAEIKTVEIRGLEAEDETEMCLLYFDNPRKGGGAIEDSRWDALDKLFYITFADAAVARAVSSRGHKLGEKVLEVSLYTPPGDDADDAVPQCTVEVRGFDPAKTELYEMYFANPRKGGDNIVDLHLSEDQAIMYITFETPDVAECVAAASPHTVGGRQLEVAVARPEDLSAPSTIIIRNCDLENEDLYMLYFENPKKGGGEIKDFVVDKNQGAILITFEDPEVAQQIVGKPHKLGGRTLEVSMYTPKKEPPQRQTSREPPQEEDGEPILRTVVITDSQQPMESEDTYTLYFESSRHGGGDVETVDIDGDKGLVFVTFADPAVADRVAKKSHKICGRPVDVKLYIPPKPKPTYPNKLLFKSVADSTTRDCLSMYLERVTDMEPQDILYGDEVGNVLVTFDGEPDLVRTQQMCQKRGLEGRRLTVSKVPISNCLMVENINPTTTKDSLELYFESKRSKGSDVEKVEMVPGENKCFVYFEDHTVLDRVLSKQHTVDGAQLVVKCYMECLGQSGGSEDPTSFALPKPVLMDSIDRYKVAFLRQCPAAKDGFLQELNANHANGKFTGDSLVVECSLTPAVPKARILARTWAVDVQNTVLSYMQVIDVHRLEVMQQLWDEVEKAVSSLNISSPDGAVLFTLSEEAAFVVAGMKSMAKELFKKLSSSVKDVEEELERKNREVTETNNKLKLYQLRLLLAMAFQVEAGKRHPGLRIDIQLKKNCIVFHGLLKDVKEAQIELYEVLQPVQDEKMTKMSDRQKKVLEGKETKPYIVQKFKAEKIAAVWELDRKNELTIYAFSDESLVKAVHIISKHVPEHVCELSPESQDLLHSGDWKNLLAQLKSENTGTLVIDDGNGQCVFITCIDCIMHGVVERVESFFQENSIYTCMVRFSPSRQLFVQQEWHQRLITLQEKLRAYKVQIILKEAGTELQIRGTTKGLAVVQKELEKMNAEILCHVEKLTDSAKVKCLSATQIDRDLKVLGQNNSCVVALTPETSDLVVIQESSPGSTIAPDQSTVGIQTVASAQLPSGASVLAVRGDITGLPVDVIVNAANNRLDHIGGLAKAIVEKGGRIIQDESYKALKSRKGQQLSDGDAVMTGSGSLRCKSIIHAVGPVYQGGYSGEEDLLHDTVLRCMKMAAEAGYTSIAFPAISTGIFRYPPVEATRVIVEAIKLFYSSGRVYSIKTVYLCHLSMDVVQMFVNAIGRTLQSAHGHPYAKKPNPMPRTKIMVDTQGAAVRGGKAANRVIKISVVEGEIAKQKADVIVNSTSNGLDLHNGAVSSSMLREAGPGLQDECHQKYPKGIQSGEIAQTSGHGLQCNQVYHVALCNWSNPNAEQVLGNMMIQCLREASKHHHSSIAFPVLGTGNLGYPADKVAKTMLGAIDQFQKDTPTTSLRNASVVVYQADKKNVQEFKAALKKIGGGNVDIVSSPPKTPAAQAKRGGTRHGRQFASYSDIAPKPEVKAAAGSGTSAIFKIGDVRFVIKQGDITQEAADAIVNSSNSQLDLSRGNVASALRSKCGPALERECKQQVSDIEQRGIATTKAYNLNSKIILHINAEKFSDNWRAGIKLCLEEAEAKGVGTLAMPALGTGAFGQSAYQSASALFDTLTSFISGAPRSLKELRVVLYDRKMIPQFVSAVEEMVVSGSSSPEVKQTCSAPGAKEFSLYIYAAHHDNIRHLLKDFDSLVKEKVDEKEVCDDIILNLSHAELDQIQQLDKEHEVEITIQQARGRVLINGMQNEVFEVRHKISMILRHAERKRQELHAASMLVNMVQWFFMEVDKTGTKPVEYGERENQIIEQAYQGKKRTAEIRDIGGNKYIIDFDSMMEYPETDPNDSVGVMRRDKIKEMAKEKLPQNWDGHNPNELLKVVSIPNTAQEYKDVEANFRKTLGNISVTITAIERIQNITLYQQYATKKAHLEKQNTGIQNEKTLWHGTGPEAIESVNNYGFNRSYCGKNATAYGQGVYFAVNTNYSAHATYSPPDSAGNRRIYQCKVLVGHATKGNSQLRVLPARKGPVLYDSATNDQSNPIMYVIFNDTQAYPEYMITFK